jgi:hypothetical protein
MNEQAHVVAVYRTEGVRMPLQSFSTPGAVTDLDPASRKAWSGLVSKMLDGAKRGHPQFFNPLTKDAGATPATKVMRWGAFSRKLARRPAPLRWELGEDRNAQEEYCEWVAIRDNAGKIKRVIFTTEVPEYYRFLALQARSVLVAIYKKHVSPNVKESDLFSGTQYNPTNRWNVLGAMHMMQGANTLGAAVTLVAQATDQRVRNGLALSNASDLIDCGIGADPERNSDPLIVTDVNALPRTKANISFTDPIGFYVDRLRTVGWTTPDGSDPAKFWKVTAAAGSAVRAVYEVPAAKKYTVSDLDQRRADQLTISDRGVRRRASDRHRARQEQHRAKALWWRWARRGRARRDLADITAASGCGRLTDIALGLIASIR